MKYFDYAATCPLDREAAEIYIQTGTEHFGNSQSLHDMGSTAENILEVCRREFSNLLDVECAGIFFTSGGSESNYLTIIALLSALRKKGKHIITGAAEHSSVYNLMKKLETEGWEVTYLPLNRRGQIEYDSVIKAARKETVLVSIHHGNPEIGTLQPLEAIAAFCKSQDVLLHSDCVQTFGKIPIASIAGSVDALSISGHKFYGPKGTGAAYINPRLAWKPLIAGTTHEKGFRPGTVNIPGIAAMTTAAQKAHLIMETETVRLRKLRSLFRETLSDRTDRVQIFGDDEAFQIPGILGMSIKGIEGQYVMLECNRKGYAISTGTACHTGMVSPAKTMTAMGITGKEAKEFFRISFGRETKAEDVEALAKTIAELSLHASAF
ncbi:IscS subfamily cysteine desulfurase [Bacillus sp. JJ1122]|uniref:IscS subfamily cysteine desulfurase n=1 Tax=Bacillus sp. JJ1122 TaxID=3122951 RepID=UPI002FFFD3A1